VNEDNKENRREIIEEVAKKFGRKEN